MTERLGICTTFAEDPSLIPSRLIIWFKLPHPLGTHKKGGREKQREREERESEREERDVLILVLCRMLSDSGMWPNLTLLDSIEHP